MKKEFIAFHSKIYYHIYHVTYQEKVFVFQLLTKKRKLLYGYSWVAHLTHLSLFWSVVEKYTKFSLIKFYYFLLKNKNH